MENYEVVRDMYVVTLENGKVVKILQKILNKQYIEGLGLDEEDAILTWLEDNEYLVNDEQEELDTSAKGSYKVNNVDKAKERKKREVVRKANPEKEGIITRLAEVCQEFGTDVVIENVGKIITFKVGNQEYKIDLVAKRQPKVK